MTKKHFFAATVALLVCTLGQVNVRAQSTTSVLTSGLLAPAKIIKSGEGNLLVAEGGNGPNTGRISIVDRDNGSRRTLVDGLPAAINLLGGEPAPSGPSGLALDEDHLFVTIGSGDATIPGPMGTELPNPSGPSSPLLSSVLAIRFGEEVEEETNGFTLTADDQVALKSGKKVKLHDGHGNKLTIRLVVDFPDFVTVPRVISSNPFGVVVKDHVLYVVDASLNLVQKVDIHTGSTETLVHFDSLANPLPFGPPFIDPVPDSIRLFGGHFLVPFLVGFPFPVGSAQVRKVDIDTGSNEPFINGLTSAIDVLRVRNEDEPDQFLVLEFSTNMLAGAPGQLLRFDSPAGPPVLIAGGLISPTSMARRGKTGDVFVTEIFTGRILKIHAP